jgi:hypothetical protein
MPAPVISSLTPPSGQIGASIVIAGSNFGATQGGSTVTFNGIAGTPSAWSAGSITVPVPVGATTGNVVVNVGGFNSNPKPFYVVSAPSNGGVTSLLNIPLYPMAGPLTALYKFDPTNFNDVASGSFYNWKVEDVIAGRTPTISRVIISYRDLGVASLFVHLSGTTDAGKAVNASQTVPIGNTVPLNIILTTVVGISLTGQNLQLSVVRAANAGPISITKVRLEGRVETTVY